MKGVIFNIQRFSIHDGPGIRTTVFLKGCNNRCLWCHNPESFEIAPQIQTYFEKCIGCGYCFEACPNGCHIINYTDNKDTGVENFSRKFKRELCIGCGKCTEECYSGALVLAGREMDINEVMTEVLKDLSYYKESGGGITISGGEPFLQPGFVLELLKESKKNGLHTTVQTALNVQYAAIEQSLPYTDLLMCDFKIFDAEKHKKYIGNSGARIRDNLKYLLSKGNKIVVRTPVIGEVNDTGEEIENICKFISDNGDVEYYELMPYHKLGLSKLETLGYENGQEFIVPSKEKMEELRRIAREYIKEVR